MHEHRFGVVVGGVGGGDFPGETAQKRVSGLPGGGLQALLPRLNPGAPHRKGDVIPGAEIPDEGLVPIGFRPPEMVIEMGGGERHPQFFPEQIHPKQQRHRIRAPGDGADHPVSRLDQPISQGGGKLIQHVSTPDR